MGLMFGERTLSIPAILALSTGHNCSCENQIAHLTIQVQSNEVLEVSRGITCHIGGRT